MNLFGSSRYTSASIFVTPESKVRGAFCPSDGRVVGQVVHSLVLGDRRWVRLCFDGGVGDSRHLQKFDRIETILRGAGFHVRESYESARDHSVPDGWVRKESRVTRPRFSALSVRETLLIDEESEIAPALLKICVGFDFHNIGAWQASVSAAALSQSLRWVGQYAESIGFHLVDLKPEGGRFRLSFRRDRKELPLYPLGDFTAANHWRTLVYFLNRLLGKFCGACGIDRRGPRPVPRLSWCPIRFDDGRQGQLVTFEGLDEEQLRIKKRELRAEFVAEGSVALFFVPSDRWNDASSGVIKLWAQERGGGYYHFPALPRPYPWRPVGPRASRYQVQDGIPLELTPLGGGQEIGANSFLLRVGGKHILLDCGQDVGARSWNPLGLPRLEHLQPLCAIIISHAHTDHVGALLTAHTLFPDVPIYCTAETLAIMRVSILHHTTESFLRRREEQLGAPLPPSKVWDEEFDRAIRVVPFDVDTPISRMPGVTFRFIPAGHILGAAGIGLIVGDRRILYTGDFCLTDQATVQGSRLAQSGTWDTVISESTNGAGHRDVVGSVDTAVESLHEILEETVNSRGLALLPAFSLGKAQEVFALVTKTLSLHWPEIPLDRVQVEGLARDFFPVYASFNPGSAIPPEPPRLGDVDEISAPGIVARILADGPRFIIATHGMMAEGTVSHSLGVSLLQQRRGTIITTGYQASGTLGAELQQFGRLDGNPDRRVHHESLPQGPVAPICAIKELQISGHAPLSGLINAIVGVAPDRVILVHGSVEAISNVKEELERALPEASIAAPTNLETISLGISLLPPGAIDEWRRNRGALPEIHPDFIIAAESKRRRPGPRHEIPVLTIVRPEHDHPLQAKFVEGRGQVIVPLSPLSLKAAIRITPRGELSLSEYDYLRLVQLPLTVHKTIVELNREELGRLTEPFYSLSLSPGDYGLSVNTQVSGAPDVTPNPG